MLRRATPLTPVRKFGVFAAGALAAASAHAGAWVVNLETRFLHTDGAVSSGGGVGDEQISFAQPGQPLDDALMIDLDQGAGMADSFTAQASIVEPTRLRASGSARVQLALNGASDNGVINARSKYEVTFTLSEPTRLRFEATAAETGLGQAWVEIRQGFTILRGITSEDADPTISEFITLPAGQYTLRAETQLNVFSFMPATLGGSGAYTVLLAPSAATLIGDLNCDGVVTVADIGPFVLALTQPGDYAAQFPACTIDNADLNADGAVSVGDIALFVQRIAGE